MADINIARRRGAHLNVPEDLCLLELGILDAAPYDAPLSINDPRRAMECFLRGLITRGLLERDPLTAPRVFVVRRTPQGDLWLVAAIKYSERRDA